VSTELTYELPPSAADSPEVYSAAAEILEDVRAIWPVDTGTSQEGWRIQVSGTTLVLSNDVDYVPYVHGGFALAEAELIFNAGAGELASSLGSAAFFDLEAALRKGALSDILNLPSLAFRAGPKRGAALVTAKAATAGELGVVEVL